MREESPTGAVANAKTSLEAIRTLAAMRRHGRTTPTPDERAALLGWAGWGRLTPLFAPPSRTWVDLATEAKTLLTPEEWKLGQQATYNAFYTPAHLAKAMWKLAADLGVDGGTVLEPGCGGGVFFDDAPAGVRMVGVDRDPVSAAIVRALNPRHEVITSPLERATLAGGFTAAIGNVPFGDVPVHDATAPDPVRSSLHNYFIWRAVRELAPGGIAVLLTSRWTMDAQADYARRAIGELADFLGAVRLPNGGLGAGTDALADVVVLRRKGDRDVEASDVDTWIGARLFQPGEAGVSVSTYWDRRPGMVLGTADLGATTRHGLGLAVTGDLGQLPAQFGAASTLLADRVAARGGLAAAPVDPGAADIGDVGSDGYWWDGEFRTVGGQLMQMRPARKPTKTKPGRGRGPERVARPSAELLHLLRLRDLARALVGLEADHDRPDADIAPTRAAALAEYEAYVAAYGALNRSTVVEDDASTPVPVGRKSRTAMQAAVAVATDVVPENFGLTDTADEPQVTFTLVTPRLDGFRHDPDWPLVAALEKYDDDTGAHEPAPILTERQNRRIVRPSTTTDPGQALAWSLDRSGGTVDVGYIAEVLGQPRIKVPELLGDRVYRDPQTLQWVVAEEYLSGRVRQKLRYAQAAAADDPGYYARNVAALEGALPPWMEAHDITGRLGVAWISPEVVKQFIVNLLEDGDPRSTTSVNRLTAGNRWEVKHGNRNTNLARTRWGVPGRNAYDLIEDALNSRVPVVRSLVGDGDAAKMVKDPDKSSVAVAKMEEIQERFGEWLWESPERVAKLVPEYNEVYNAIVPRVFDGSHLTGAGLAPWFAKVAYPHQWDYVARAVGTRSALCGHPVGAGKTATMAMVVMKLRELQLIRTGMIAVPKHLLEQTTRQIRQLFPAAKVLAVSSESISANRREFAARVATQGYDMVVITHSAFDKIRVWEGTEADYIAAQQQILDAAIRASSKTGELEPGMVKAAAKMSDRLTARIQELRERAFARDPGTITFEQLGGGLYLCIDEAHYYKNLALAENLPEGFAVAASKRATDLDMRRWWLEKTNPGPVMSLFTGTPVANSLIEVYVFLQYLMQDQLTAMGLGSPSAWAATFVEMATTVDVTVTGESFNLKTRPAAFFNADELRMLLSQCADIRTREQLGLAGPGRAEVVETIPQTSAGIEFSEQLVEWAEEARSNSRFNYDPGKKNMLQVCTYGRQAATDLALVGINDPEPGKLHRVAERVLKVWRENPAELQIVFCDVGTPNPKRGGQTYGRLKALLVAGGMPAGQVEFVHDHPGGRAKSALFARCRKDGGISVIMGSTDKLGVGTNIQDRVIAIHHVDAPFRPADVDQRDGRGIRPGNRHAVVQIFRYVTQRTFDAYMWQLLTRKAAFIQQVLSGELGRRVQDVVSDVVLMFASIKAAATDQPLLIEKAEIQPRLKQLTNMHRAWKTGQRDLHEQIASSPWTVDRIKKEIGLWERIASSYTGQVADADAEVLTVLAGEEYAYRPVTVAGVRVHRKSWRDLKDVVHPAVMVGAPGQFAEGGHEIRLYKFDKPGAWVDAFKRTVYSAERNAEGERARLRKHRDQVQQARELAALPFKNQDEMTALQVRLAEIEAELHAAVRPDHDKPVTDADRAEAAVVASFTAAAAGEATVVEVDLGRLFADPEVVQLVESDLSELLSLL